MDEWQPKESSDGTWSSPISPFSPLSLSSCESFAMPGTLRLDVGEFEAEPFSTKFVDLFDGLGLHVSKDETDNKHKQPGTPDTNFGVGNYSGDDDMASGWRYPEELVAMSSKRPRSNMLPTIHEDHQESRCSIVPPAALSDFEFEFDAFDRPSANGTTTCVRRDNQTTYTMKRKRAARNSWSEQNILEILTNQELPFIARLCWSFHSGEHIYIITDHHTGNDLEDLVRQQGPLNINRATFYAAELVSAMSSLHAAGIMHRDLEPRNIQLDSQGHIILTNFGHAEFVKHIVESSQRCTSPAGLHIALSVYCAPEVILGWTHDHAVDCWSFGMVLYYMVFGTTPYASADGRQDDRIWLHDQVVRSAIPTESLRLVHPMARDLILKCLERNPALRWDADRIKSHGYFSSIDWEKISSFQEEVPLLEKPPVRSLKTLSIRGSDGHQRHSSLNLSLLNFDRQSISKAPSTVHRRSQSLQRPSAPEPTGDDTPMVSLGLFRSLGRAMSILHEDETMSTSQKNDNSEEIACERRAFEEDPDIRISQFWDDLDKEDCASVASANSLEFGMSTGVPYTKAPKLRKYRSAIQARSRLFNVSTSSFQVKMGRKPRSTGALRQPKPVEVIENLPLGIHQIGSGIGFTYSVPAAAPSKVSVGSFAPSCHLFQRGFSVRNLGLSLGNSSVARMKAKPQPPAPTPATVHATPSDTHIQSGSPTCPSQPHLRHQLPARSEMGNRTFIREMTRSPSWILAPADSLPSPMALVNADRFDSPSSVASGSEPLSPMTLVNLGEEAAPETDEAHCVNITIPKSLELGLDFPLAAWAPDATLRLVPQTAESIRLPYIESEDGSLCVDQTWAS